MLRSRRSRPTDLRVHDRPESALTQLEPRRTHQLAEVGATITMPEVLGEPRASSADGPWRTYEIGDIRRDLLMAELVILRDDGTSTPGEFAQEREQLLQLPGDLAGGVIAIGEARELDGAAHPTTERSYRITDRLEMVLWSQRTPDAGVQGNRIKT